MALIASDFAWYLSGALAAGGSQPNPAASLGHFRSSTRLSAVRSTFTAAATAGALRVVDAAQIGQSHTGKWILCLTGACGGAVGFFATRVETFDGASGTFGLRDPLPAAVAGGDVYALYAASNLFDAVSAADCGTGRVDHRLLIARNETGSNLAATRFYLEPVDPGPVGFEIVSDNNVSGDIDYVLSPSAIASPDLSQFWSTARFTSPRARDSSVGAQPGDPASVTLSGSAAQGIWVRRTVPALARASTVVWKLVLSSTSVGVDPNPYAAATLLVFSLVGISPTLALTTDRFIRIAGGARVYAEARDGASGAALDGETIRFAATGPGGLEATEAETDEDGVAWVSYTASIDPADEGSTVDFDAEV